MPIWQMLDPRMTTAHLGLLPEMLSDNDPNPASKQFDKNYQHGGGWNPFKGFKLSESHNLSYPGDPPMSPLAITHLREKLILFYPHSWVVIKQPDGSFEACRMD